MSQVWMPGTQGTEYWPSGAKLKSSGGEPESSREERWSTVVEDKMTPILFSISSSSPCFPKTLSARVLVELSADVVKIGTGDEDDQASKSAACVKEEEVPFGEPKSHVSSRSWTEEGEEL
ncbi:hypothetical protein TYRP_022925 [Tyrophagus putrescentiae]|nr:hypothetical protein TYRP_022925 [Tyrophagus putrescentiae]